jgi:hypothetical protein
MPAEQRTVTLSLQQGHQLPGKGAENGKQADNHQNYSTHHHEHTIAQGVGHMMSEASKKVIFSESVLRRNLCVAVRRTGNPEKEAYDGCF